MTIKSLTRNEMCLSSSTNTSEISRIIAIICFLIYSICTSQQQCNALLSPNKQVASCQAQETHLLHVSLNRKPTILGRRKQAGRRKRCLYLHDDNDLSIRGGDLPSNALPKRRTLLRNVAGALIIGLPLLGEAYSRRIFDWKKDNLDKQFLNDPKKGWDKVRHATIVFHGAGGQDEYTKELMSRLQSNDKAKNNGYSSSSSSASYNYATIIDWSKYSKNTLQASFNAQRIGRQVAKKLIKKATRLQSVHMIGISVGAFASDACCTEIRTMKPRFFYGNKDIGHLTAAVDDGPYIQLTLLAPFCQRGIIDPWYGSRIFGKSADYAQQYINTNDPVFSTHSPLPLCACTDVTNLRPKGIFGHDWPLAYYARKGKVGLVEENEQRPRGSLIIAQD